MSESDRRKWDQRYADGAFASRTDASALLQQQWRAARPGPALDVACGAGRNAIFLAHEGFSVDAIDISEQGLDRARTRAQAEGVNVNWLCQDLLEHPQIPRDDYQLIIMFRFVAMPLLRLLTAHLAPGGILLVEEHLQVPSAELTLAGPSSDRFRVAPGALRDAAGELHIEYYFEGITEDPDGKAVALAQMLARNS